MEAYSKTNLTRVLLTLSFADLELVLMFLLTKPSGRFLYDAVLDTWLCHVRLFVMLISKDIAVSTSSSAMPLK